LYFLIIYMPYKDLSIEEIENWAGIKREEVPKYLIVDCAWPGTEV
jgi:hypothetical protein